jgi:hypothetical protein
MPMLDIQRRHAEVFRIRLGDKGPKGQPQKLTDSIRVTSPNHSVVAAFADVYGGEVSAWEQQWQVYLPVTALPVMILPGQSIVQWWEAYRQSVCERRCDGFTEQLSGQPCMCPEDITVRMQTKGACRPMTRINVVCPEVAVVGAGSLVTHGMIAAETLPQSVAVAEAALARGLMVPGMLRVIVHEGKKHYVVPQLEIVGVTLAQLETGEVERPAVTAADRPELAPPAPKAIAAPSRPAETNGPRRPAVAPPLPGEENPPFDESNELLVDPQAVRDFIIEMGKAFPALKGKDLDDLRHAMVHYATKGRTSSSKAVMASEWPAVLAVYRWYSDAKLALVDTNDGPRLVKDLDKADAEAAAS